MLAVAAVACGTTKPSPSVQPRPTIIPTTPELISGGEPQTNGTMWVLAGSAGAKTIQEISLASDARLEVVPVNADASAIAATSDGTLAVGYADSAGTVELRSASTGALEQTLGVGQPVKCIAAEGETDTFFVLDGTGSATTVNPLSTSGRSGGAIGVELDSVALAVAPDGSNMYLLQSSGSVVDYPIQSGGTRLASSSFFGGVGAIGLALSGDGSTLFVLKKVKGGDNVGVFNVTTEEQKKVLAAPAGSVDVIPSLDGAHLYLLVGTPTVGNIQVIPVG